MERSELIGLGIRVISAAALSFITVRYLIKYMDPNYQLNEEHKKKMKLIFAELGLDRSIDLNEHEIRIATQFIGADDLGADWDDVGSCIELMKVSNFDVLGGCDELIAELKERIILPLRFAAEVRSTLLAPPKGILLYGPPGCGKTLLAKAVARAAGCRFINLQVSNLTDKWYGESQKLAAAVFSVAQKFQPTIIFIDEIDSFLRDRQSHDHEATAMMKAQFMTLWDGFTGSSDQIIVMGATNRPHDVDPAILRRMAARFHVPVPSEKQRTQILKVLLRSENIANDVRLEDVAAAANGLSGSDLKEVSRLAMLTRAKATIADGGSLQVMQPLQQDDLMFAVVKYMRTGNLLIEDRLD